jgi:hypothetical protein
MGHIGLETESLTGAVPLTEEQFLKFKEAIPGSQIKKYKGRSIHPANLTEIFDLTARQNVDYSADITEFERMREDLEDLSLTIVFAYNESTFPLRLNLLTRGIYFPAFVTESAIDYIYDIYSETILRG